MKEYLRRKSFKESGITLIALVVTIIVLLILASVTIQMVLGENGIIMRAKEASNVYEAKRIEEEATLENLASKIRDYNGQQGDNEDTVQKITFLGGNEEEITGSNEELVSHYGETVVSYSSVQGVTWQLFYDDLEYYYVIASDYIDNPPSEMIECTCPGITPNPSKVAFAQLDYWYINYDGPILSTSPWNSGGYSSVFTTSNTFSNYFANLYLKWNSQDDIEVKDYDNMKCVAYMLDTSKWSSFASGEPGSYAMGGPTLELFVKSWNAAHSDPESQIMSYDTLNSSNYDASGYLISGFGTNEYDLGSSSNMWSIIQDVDGEQPYAMWMASPIGMESENNYLYTAGNGSISYSELYKGSEGDSAIFFANAIRPVVAIPKRVS